MEISSCLIFIETARHVNDHATALVCGNILREEQAMAHGREENLGAVTRRSLQQEEAGVTAKY
jgi:hypothetical protein